MATAVQITLIICGTLLAGWAIMWNSIRQDIEKINRKDDK